MAKRAKNTKNDNISMFTNGKMSPEALAAHLGRRSSGAAGVHNTRPRGQRDRAGARRAALVQAW